MHGQVALPVHAPVFFEQPSQFSTGATSREALDRLVDEATPIALARNTIKQPERRAGKGDVDPLVGSGSRSLGLRTPYTS